MSGLSLQEKTQPVVTITPVTYRCCFLCEDLVWPQGTDGLADESPQRAVSPTPGCSEGQSPVHRQDLKAFTPEGSSQALQGCSSSEQRFAPGVDFLAAGSRRDGCRSLTALRAPSC